jgi:hypothetical protein
MKDRSLGNLINRAQAACADVLSVAPFKDSPEIRRIAGKPGGYFETKVTPDAITIDIVAGDERARVFGYGATSTFGPEAA